MTQEEFPPFGGPPIGMETTRGKSKKTEEIPLPSREKTSAEQLNTVMARLRDMERRFTDVQDLIKFHEEDSRKNTTRLWERLKQYEEKMTALTHTLAELDQQTHLIINELRLTAKREDYEVLRRVIEYIKPVKFVTTDQVEKLVKEILEEQNINTSTTTEQKYP